MHTRPICGDILGAIDGCGRGIRPLVGGGALTLFGDFSLYDRCNAFCHSLLNK
jgi:hypothetical protein